MSDASIDDRPSVAARVARAVVPGRYRPFVGGVVRSLKHPGDAVHCPCCGGSFGRFREHRGRPTAKCPRCGSLERHRLLLIYLRERTDIFSSRLSVLHVAPEFCLGRRLQKANLRYVSADLDSPLAMQRADLMQLPYPDASFDIVICNHVLEHVGDDRRALREIRRVLARRGRAILMSPIDERCAETHEDPSVTTPDERQRVFGQSDHVRRYGRDFGDRVAAEGFSVSAIRYLDELDPEVVAHQGLRRDDEVFQHDDVFVCVAAAAVTDDNSTQGSEALLAASLPSDDLRPHSAAA